MDLKILALTAALCAVILSAAMLGAWAIQRRTGNTGWIDVIWSFSVGGVSLLAAIAPLAAEPSLTVRQAAVGCLVGVWSARLGGHILLRTRAVGDDPRYRKLIQEWGESADSRMLRNLQIQAVVGVLLCMAVMLAARNPSPVWRLQDVLGWVILAGGIIGEMVADHQVRRCRQLLGAGAVCTTGLWRLSRHPNYFFEWVCWCAYPVIAVDFGGGYPLGWLALIAPLCMFWLLTSVSGIPPLEEHMIRTRGEAYRAYQRRTNAFFPFPKKGLRPET